MDTSLASNIVMIFSMGMGIAFFAADRRSPTSRVLALFLAFIGISIGIGGNFLRAENLISAHPMSFWAACNAATIGISISLGAEWVLRVRRTIPSGELRTGFGDGMLRLSQVIGVIFATVGILFPDQYQGDFLGALETGAKPGMWFWVFDSLMWAAMVPAVGAGILTLRRKPDRSEMLRLLALAVSSPFLAASLITDFHTGVTLLAIGLVIFLIGAVQYHVLQGQQGLFMQRFLAPQVAELVRDQGMKEILAEQKVELSAVVCDLRGFTRFAEANGSERTIKLLRHYYDLVGEAAREIGATIKDYAGDGLLILVGAPLQYPDHRERALRLATRLHEITAPIEAETGLGLGVGMASGKVSVGIIGGERLEYVAVGQAVNLASRLCEQAVAGETLIDDHFGSDAHGYALESRGTFELKGIANPISAFSVAPA